MKKLSEEQRIQWDVDGYVVVEGALSSDQVSFFNDEIDRIRTVPGWEPVPDNLPRGHYGWVEKCADQDPEAFMDRRDILPYHQAFIDRYAKIEVARTQSLDLLEVPHIKRKIKPRTIMVTDITTNVMDFRNDCYAEYFGITAIRIY